MEASTALFGQLGVCIYLLLLSKALLAEVNFALEPSGMTLACLKADRFQCPPDWRLNAQPGCMQPVRHTFLRGVQASPCISNYVICRTTRPQQLGCSHCSMSCRACTFLPCKQTPHGLTQPKGNSQVRSGLWHTLAHPAAL